MFCKLLIGKKKGTTPGTLVVTHGDQGKSATLELQVHGGDMGCTVYPPNSCVKVLTPGTPGSSGGH